MELDISFDRPLRVDDALVSEVMSLVNTFVDEDARFTFLEIQKFMRFYLPESRKERDMLFMRDGKVLCGVAALIQKPHLTFAEVEIRAFYCLGDMKQGSHQDLFLGHVVRAAKSKLKTTQSERRIITYFPRGERECKPHLFAELHGFAVKSFRSNSTHSLEFVNHFEKVVAP